jgi:hypothetical protein
MALLRQMAFGRDWNSSHLGLIEIACLCNPAHRRNGSTTAPSGIRMPLSPSGRQLGGYEALKSESFCSFE